MSQTPCCSTTAVTMSQTASSRSTNAVTAAAVVAAQLESIDDTDPYATAWADAVQQQQEQAAAAAAAAAVPALFIAWGGRGRGGRGRARQTWQPHHVVVDSVPLEYTVLTTTPKNATTTTTTNNNNNNHPKLPRTTEANSAATLLPSTTLKTTSRVLLRDQARLKLISGHVYAVVGPNGCGKSTLLRRMHAHKIPGFPLHYTTLLVDAAATAATAVAVTTAAATGVMSTTTGTEKEFTALDWLLQQHEIQEQKLIAARRWQVQDLEQQMDKLIQRMAVSSSLPSDSPNDDHDDDDDDADGTDSLPQQMERLAQEMAALEEEEDDDNNNITQHGNAAVALQALQVMGIDRCTATSVAWTDLSPGQRQKVALSQAWLSDCHLLLLDEPTYNLDVPGLLQLRYLIAALRGKNNNNISNNRGPASQQEPATTIVIISHDVDLINHVATQVIEFTSQQLLQYYHGNYDDYSYYKNQHVVHTLRTSVALEKKQQAAAQTLEHLKQQPAPKRGGHKKKAKQIASYRKKMEREGMCTKNNNSDNNINVEASAILRGLTLHQRLQLAQQRRQAPPAKAVQFVLSTVLHSWSGTTTASGGRGNLGGAVTRAGPAAALIQAVEVGHGYNPPESSSQAGENPFNANTGDRQESDRLGTFFVITKNPGFLFDCIDLSIHEGGRYAILGPNGSGTSTLLRILAKQLIPREGTVQHAPSLDVAYMYPQQLLLELQQQQQQNQADMPLQVNSAMTSLLYLATLFPHKTEHELRGELTNFGLNPSQAATPICYLSSGEQVRLNWTAHMLRRPQVLLLDQPTCGLDLDSVEALIHGLQQWTTGTVIITSHDAHFIRSLEASCYVLMPEEGKLRKIPGGIDAYLRSFGTKS